MQSVGRSSPTGSTIRKVGAQVSLERSASALVVGHEPDIDGYVGLCAACGHGLGEHARPGRTS